MTCPPVLLILFRRPDQTRRVFQAIRQARPTRLYLAADGPRTNRPGEAEACQEARAVLGPVDWPCEVKTFFRDANVGIRRNVAEAITWFLNDANEGIILEDDCLPSPDFFDFCAQALDRYRDDTRIMQICGSGFHPDPEPVAASYFFSRYNHGWGWATWRRAWDKLDLPLVGLEAFLTEADRTGFWDSPRERTYWRKMFRRTRDWPIDTWDYQWKFSLWKEGGLALYPQANMVTNLGFGEGASNTHQKEVDKGDRPFEALGTLVHPEFVIRHRRADLANFHKMYWGHPWKRWGCRIQKGLRMLWGRR